MQEKEAATNLRETIAHYEIYESLQDHNKNTVHNFFIVDTANEHNILHSQWTIENARDYVQRLVDAEAAAYENRRNNRRFKTVKPHVSDSYEVGALLVYSWGYDQTNIDYYCIVDVSKSGDYVTLLPVRSAAIKETGWLQGECVASNTINFEKKAFRRKLARDKDSKPFGVAINSYGWCSLYDGGVDHWTAYH